MTSLAYPTVKEQNARSHNKLWFSYNNVKSQELTLPTQWQLLWWQQWRWWSETRTNGTRQSGFVTPLSLSAQLAERARRYSLNNHFPSARFVSGGGGGESSRLGDTAGRSLQPSRLHSLCTHAMTNCVNGWGSVRCEDEVELVRVFKVSRWRRTLLLWTWIKRRIQVK